MIGSWLLDIIAIVRLTDSEKDLELLILRHQINILERQVKRPRLSRLERLSLAVIANKLKQRADRTRQQLAQSILIFKPETVLGWHRELVRRKWTFKQLRQPGRPRTDPDIEALIVRLARENPRMGYRKIEGELLKLGYDVGKTIIKEILRRHGIPPVPERGRSSWRAFLKHYRHQMIACDFFTVETVLLRTLYVLFFIELGTRRVHVVGCTSNPDSAWVTQQARNLTWDLQEQGTEFRYLIHDRDSKFAKSFDQVFEAEGCKIVLTPRQAPDANSYAERWVRTARNECFDHILIFNGVNARFANRPISCRYCGNSRPTTMKGDLIRELTNALRQCRSHQAPVTVQFAVEMCSEASFTITIDLLRRPVSLWESISAPYGVGPTEMCYNTTITRLDISAVCLG